MGTFQTKAAIITGATGMIGQALIKELLKNQIAVLAIVRPDSNKWKNLPNSRLLSIISCNLSELSTIKQISESAQSAASLQKGEILSAYQMFFHLGWDNTFGESRNDVDSQTANITYTLDAVKLASHFNCKVFIGAGSQAEYGRVSGAISAETPAFPENGYGIAKLCAGQMAALLCSQLEIRLVWSRILSIYGPGDNPETMVMSSIRDYLSDLSPSHTKGEQQWDYLYVSDCARALYLLAESERANGVYCIGSGQTKALKEYVRIIRDLCAPKIPLRLGIRPYARNQVMHLEADIDKLTKDTGFQPEVSFDEGIKKTILWWKKEKDNENC